MLSQEQKNKVREVVDEVIRTETNGRVGTNEVQAVAFEFFPNGNLAYVSIYQRQGVASFVNAGTDYTESDSSGLEGASGPEEETPSQGGGSGD